MNRTAAPSLDDLVTASKPAWLWDPARARIVWANPAGIAAFGGETLFDLLDLPFSSADSTIQRLRQLARELRRGEHRDEWLDFPQALTSGEIAVRCHPHALADGRNGVLVVATSADAGGEDLAAGAASTLLATLPLGVVVASLAGDPVYANPAARQALAGASPARLLGELRSGDTWDRLCAAVERDRTGTATQTIETPLGPVDLKLTASAVVGDDGNRQMSLLIQDVTERRALERSLLGLEPDASNDGEPALAAAADREPAAKPGETPRALSEDDARAFERLGAALETVKRDIASPRPLATPAPATETSGTPAQRPFAEVPDIVVRTLGPMAQAIVLHHQGRLIYANTRAGQLFGCADGEALASLDRFADVLASLAAGEARIEASDSSDRPVVLRAEHAGFPWRTGSITRSVLYPVDTVEPDDEPVAPQPEPVRPATVTQAAKGSPAVSDTPDEEPASEKAAAADAEPAGPPPTDQAPARASDPTPTPQRPAGDAEMAELRAILDTATDGVVTLDAAGKVISFSAGAQALFGYDAREAAGRPFADYFADVSRRTVEEYLAALGERGLASVFNDGREVEASVKQGGTVPVFLTLGRLQQRKPDSGGAAFCAVVRDITQWKKTEAELKGAKERAEESSAQKSEFLARISHELRTPLNAIIGFSEVMRTERFGEIQNQKYLGYANDIHSSGEHLLSLINDLLDLSKVEAGKLELNFTSVNVGQVIDSALQLMADLAAGRRVVLRKQVQNDLPNVVADIRSLRQILLNLVSNAVKFTDAGGQVIVSARTTREGELKIRVKDTGIGMDEAELSEALEPFARVQREGHEEVEGTGLGLPLSRALTEANRARFTITSEPGKGTLVEVTFPTTRVLAD